MYKLDITNSAYYFAMGALNAGRTAVGIQATDILEGMRIALRQLPDGTRVRLVGEGVLAPPSVFAACMFGGVDELVTEHGLWGYEAIATNRVFAYYIHPETITVTNLLPFADLPELALSSGSRRVIWKTPADQDGAPLAGTELEGFRTLTAKLAGIFGMKENAVVE
jgi:hypothetical protein